MPATERAGFVGDQRRAASDRQCLQRRPPPRHPDQAALGGADRNEGEPSQHAAPRERRRDVQSRNHRGQERQERDHADDHERDEGRGSRTDRGRVTLREPVLLAQHGVDPDVAVRTDHLHSTIQVGPGEAFPSEDLANLFPFTGGNGVDVKFFVTAKPRSALRLGTRSEEVPCGHAEPIGEQVRHAQDHDHLRSQARSDGTCGDREGRDRSVDRAEHERLHVVRPRASFESLLDGFGSVLLSEVVGIVHSADGTQGAGCTPGP